MANTEFAKLPALSSKIYKEWLPKTVLVQSCDNSFEGEFDLEKREVDIPVYHDISIHKTSIKERELKPAKIEFIKASTKRVSIDKGRYSHWGQTKLSKLIDKLSAEDSEVRQRLIRRWAIEAEEELAIYCAKLKSNQEIDAIDVLSDSDGIIDEDNVMEFLDILKAHAKSKHMSVGDFKLFTSEKFETILRNTKIPMASLDANETFRTGSVGIVNSVDVREIDVPAITKRDDKTKMVTAEWGIWKTRDGIQYVVPYKNTVSYDIQPTEVLEGGTGYQTVEYYDFFNLYPSRLYKVKMRYAASANPPTTFS